MKRILSVLLCAAMLFTAMSGCVQQEETIIETTEPTQGVTQVALELPQDQRPYVGMQLQFLSHLAPEDPRAGVLQQAAQVFEARTGAAVQFSWQQGDEAALAAQLSGGEPVDIFAAPVDLLMDQLLGQALDLTALAEGTGYAEHSHQVLRNQIIGRCGYLAAVPQEPMIYGVYYNSDVFADSGVTEYPESWADFLALSEALVQKGYMPLCMDIQNAHLILELHLERHLGIDQFKKLLSTAGWTQKTEYIELFRLAIDYASAGYLAKGDPAEYPAGQDKLALSNVAMVVGSNELCGQVEKSTMMDVNWGVFPYPGDGPGRGCTVESQVLAVHKDSANAQAAFDFIILLSTGEFDQLYADVSGGIPADPQNRCTIAGAQELLGKADVRIMGLLTAKNQVLFSQLWNGWYKTPSYFASAMNGLAKDYKGLAAEGVG